MAFTAAQPIDFQSTVPGFDRLREFYTVLDEKKKEKAKEEATEFKALQSLAKVRGWADPNVITTADLGSLRGFIKGKYDEESETVKQQELAIRKLAAERENTYAKPNIEKLLEFRTRAAAAGASPEDMADINAAIKNESIGQKQLSLEEKRQQNRLKREEFMATNRETLANLRNQFVIEAEARKAAAGGSPRFVLNDRDKMMMESELNFVEKWVDPDEAKQAFVEIEEKYKARAIRPQVAPAPPEEAPGKTPERSKAINGRRIKVKDKDGNEFTIPEENLERAKLKGYTPAE
jgi:hypothetical protein